MTTMNSSSFLTASLFDCARGPGRPTPLPPIWQQTMIGCRVLMLLQDMYNFRLTYYIRGTEPNLTDTEVRHALYPRPGLDVDIFARPMVYRPGLQGLVDPVHHIHHRRFGFLLKQPDFGLFHSFYSEPFCPNVWHCMVLMLLLSACIFYVSQRWEKRLFGSDEECSFWMELMLAITACCQQTPPVFPKLMSRRTAYFSFSVFAYGMYSFYTSNLLSHLVSDRDRKLELDDLADSEYECAVLESQVSIVYDSVSPSTEYLMRKKFSEVQTVSLEDGLLAVKNTSAALLSDFVTVYPAVKETFSEEELCQLFEVDMFTNVQCYLFTRKGFPLLEHFKVGTLRLLESGILRRTAGLAAEPPPACLSSPAVSIELDHITLPLAVLGCAMLSAVLFLIMERVQFARRQLWPFVL